VNELASSHMGIGVLRTQTTSAGEESK
jgi:hypothetical protein